MSDAHPSIPPALTKADLPEIVRRYQQGETLQQLAAEAHVHRATLYRWLLSDLGDGQYYETITDCLVNRIAEADDCLSTATNMCDVTRANHQARFARFDLERRRPHLYGQRQAITVETVDLTAVIQEAKSRTRKHQTPQPVDITPPSDQLEPPESKETNGL